MFECVDCLARHASFRLSSEGLNNAKINNNSSNHGCINTGRLVAVAAKFCTVENNMELAIYNIFGAYNFKVAPRFLENLLSPAIKVNIK
jgi:hypothetical protein